MDNSWVTEVTVFLFLLHELFNSMLYIFNKSDNMCLDVIKLVIGSQPHLEKKDLVTGSIWSSKSFFLIYNTQDINVFDFYIYKSQFDYRSVILLDFLKFCNWVLCS